MVLSLLKGIIEALDPQNRNPKEVENQVLADLGRALAERIGRATPYSHRYLRSLLNETLEPPKEDSDLAIALQTIAQEIDGTPKGIAGAVPVTVFVPAHLAEDIQDSLLIKKPVLCHRPACFVRFIPNAPNQKYHSDLCRLLHYKERK